jgi:hypothetical protein
MAFHLHLSLLISRIIVAGDALELPRILSSDAPGKGPDSWDESTIIPQRIKQSRTHQQYRQDSARRR